MDLIFSGQLLFSALVLGAFYALAALGLNLVYGTMRVLNLAHGDMVMIGAYVAYWAFTLLGLSPLIGLMLAALLAALLGAGTYHGLIRGEIARARNIAQLEANSLLILFGASVIVQNAVSLAFSASPRAFQHLDQVLHFGNIAMTLNRLSILAVAVTICLAVAYFLRRSVYGLAVKALIQDRMAARIVGVEIERMQLLCFALGFAVAGIAGAMISMTEQISPFMGLRFTIAAFVVIILGGLGNITGGILAGLLLGFIEVYGVALTSANWGSIILYGFFIVVLVARPQGLLGGMRLAR